MYQEYTRINRAISTGDFFTNQTLTEAVDKVAAAGKAVHFLGLLSPGGVHSHEDHIHAMAELAVKRGASALYLHAFLDGRDMPPKSAAASIQAMEDKFRALGTGRIASLIGRHYAMDRDRRWERIKTAYDLLTLGKAEHHAGSARQALELAYARGETDEFVQATAVTPNDSAPVRIEDGDVVIFVNFRSDRARELTQSFIEPDFDAFKREALPSLAAFVTLTEYNREFHVPVVFPPLQLHNVLGEYLSRLGKRQLRIAETEKYAHVTFFFNGGRETPFSGEDRLLIPSPTDVKTYNLKPEMSALQVTDELINAVEGGSYDVIICNFANTDMVGHTGDFDATVRAVEVLDRCIARIGEALKQAGGEMLVTADHGNAEQLYDEETGQAHTAHTTNLVPFIYMGRNAEIAATGALEDVAPTMLYIMGLPIPSEMTGHPLIRLSDEEAA